ncbi:MAG TPA: hypothetical protein VFN55_10100 [Solirubrobacteraceae bacterium]|nr:hypothetical protein [Solirubrobacteraceae bacterium]
MPDEYPARLRCVHCAEVIGVYEPMWIQTSDGTLRETSMLNLAAETPAGRALRGVWHLGCLAAETITHGAGHPGAEDSVPPDEPQR